MTVIRGDTKADIQALRSASATLRQLVRPPGSKTPAFARTYDDAYHRCYLLCEQLFRGVGPTVSIHVCLRLLEEFLPAFKSLHPRNRAYKAAIDRIQRTPGSENLPRKPCWLKRYSTRSSKNFAWAIEELHIAMEDVEAGGGCKHANATTSLNVAELLDEVLKGEDLSRNLLRRFTNDPNGWAPHCRDAALSLIVGWGYFEAERIAPIHETTGLNEEQNRLYVETIAERWDALATVCELTAKSKT